ncbi:MAG: hypothetical protein JWQ09_1186 [Segetibacter sp.]|nr:hypothetical protein [Segetibacter sp.]
MFHYTSYGIRKCNGFLWAKLYCCYFSSLRRTLVQLSQYSPILKVSSANFWSSKYLYFYLISFSLFACKKPYEPAVITSGNNYLVVDGFINTTLNGVTTINLSRARNINDSTFDVLPEGNANISIESSNGASYPLQQISNGKYESNPLSLSSSETYRLNITTANGNRYQSDLVIVKQSPAVDSITWQQKNDVTIYANTHDPANNTKYYRWDFVETWQYTAKYETFTGVSNHLIYYRDSTNFIYNCWSTANSTSIVLGTSAALGQDVISKAPVTTIIQNDTRLGVRYSILVRQYALTQEAFEYLQIIQKNSERTGSLFDLQPSQLHGNIHSLANKNEPVIGFVSAGSVQQKRIFIKHSEVTNWVIQGPSQEACNVIFIGQNPTNYLIFDYPDTSYAPYYFTSGGGMAISKKACFDCTLQGGSNIKPSFW